MLLLSASLTILAVYSVYNIYINKNTMDAVYPNDNLITQVYKSAKCKIRSYFQEPPTSEYVTKFGKNKYIVHYRLFNKNYKFIVQKNRSPVYLSSVHLLNTDQLEKNEFNVLDYFDVTDEIYEYVGPNLDMHNLMHDAKTYLPNHFKTFDFDSQLYTYTDRKGNTFQHTGELELTFSDDTSLII
ncbi:hypothetical protein OAF54_03105 [bacterium]|nr:hypothetical protein [bacterium]